MTATRARPAAGAAIAAPDPRRSRASGETVQISASLLAGRHRHTFEWDLDGDGSLRPAGRPGLVATASFTAGPHTVRVRVTDARGRTAVARQVDQRLSGATGNLAPHGGDLRQRRRARVGRRRLSFSAFGVDHDGIDHRDGLGPRRATAQFDDSASRVRVDELRDRRSALRRRPRHGQPGRRRAVGVQEIEVHTENRPPRRHDQRGRQPRRVAAHGRRNPGSAVRQLLRDQRRRASWRWRGTPTTTATFDDGTETSKLVTLRHARASRACACGRPTRAGSTGDRDAARRCVRADAPTSAPVVPASVRARPSRRPGAPVSLYAIAHRS